MFKINPDIIRINPQTIIIITGISNSGKTTFAKKNFKNLKIISSDEAMEEAYAKHEKELYAACTKGDFLKFNCLQSKISFDANIITQTAIKKAASKDESVVYDALSWKKEPRMFFKTIYAPLFKHVINICIFESIDVIKSRKPKSINMIGRSYFTQDQLMASYQEYISELDSGQLFLGFYENYVIDPKKDIEIIFE